MHYQQLYDPAFPQRWRARVLASIGCCHGADPKEAEAAAVKTAADQGLHPDALTPEQLAFWLTDEEIRSLAGW